MITIITNVEFKDGVLESKTELARSGSVNRPEHSMAEGLLAVMNSFIRKVAEQSGDAEMVSKEVAVKDIPKA